MGYRLLLYINKALIPVLAIILFSCSAYGQMDNRLNAFHQLDRTQLVYFAPDKISDEYRDRLNSIISLNVSQETIENVLKEVASRAGLRLLFSADVTLENWDQPISLDIEEATVLGALYAALHVAEKKDVKLVMSRFGQVIISKNDIAGTDLNPAGNNAENNRKEALTGTGTIFGEVRDAVTGETLPGANVIIQDSRIGVATDVHGRYTLRQVPAGDQIMEIRYMGFVTQQISIHLSEGEALEQTVMLVPDLIEGDEIFVTAFQRGQARALTRQRESVNIRSVVSAEQIDRFADQTIEGALQRVAGMGHGGTNIRGVGAAMTNVTMDGQRMGSTGADRSVDLGTISADMVADLEVIKVITPDMDADAMAGVINVNTRRPIGGQRTMNARLGGGWNSRFLDVTGPSARGSLSYGDSPSDHFSYGVNLSYLRSVGSSEDLGLRYETTNLGAGPIDVLTQLRPRMRFSPTDRYGTAMQFTFQPTDRTTFHVQGMFNYLEGESHTFQKDVSPEIGRYYTPNQTGNGSGGAEGFPTNWAMMPFGFELSESDIHQYTFQFSARHLFERMDMEYALGWGHGRTIGNTYNFEFRSNERYDYLVNIEDRLHPEVDFTYWSPQNWPREETMAFRRIDHRWDNHIDNEFLGRIDFTVPFKQTTFKFGASAIMAYKDGKRERYRQELLSNVTIKLFDKIPNRDWPLFERSHQAYQLPWLLDLHSARDWYYTNYPHFRADMEVWAQEKETSKYFANENTFAGYGMMTVRFGRFTFLGGVRVEHTTNSYDGRDARISQSGNFLGAEDVSASNDFTNLFPNAQLVFALSRFTNARLAYSRSIGRPGFNELNPQLMRDYYNERLSGGNPNLKPMVANNLDFLVDHYFLNVGQISLGLFYKDLTDFVYRFQDIVGPGGVEGLVTDEEEGLYAGWNWSTYMNGDEATVYGFEMSWQQNLDFLPGFLSNLGVYTTYSYAHSVSDIGRRDTDGNVVWAPLAGQRPHVVNAGLDFSLGGFFTQVSYQWGAPSLSSYGSPRWVPPIQLRERVYFDSYRDAANNMSMTVRYRLTENFRLWADGSNLLNYRSISYQYDRDYYPTNVSLSGRTVNVGIHYTF